jgi:hypothetical protein
MCDKYYTKPEISLICCKYINDNIKIEPADLIIEPSAGNGSFINPINNIFKCDKLYFDIEPEHENIKQQDFLIFNNNNYNLNSYHNIHIIGNPPFGKNSSLVLKFFKKACSINSKTISFILPKSFKKESLKNKIDLRYSMIFEYDIPLNSFYYKDNEYNISCVFQIWILNENTKRIILKEPPKNNLYEFVKKNNNPSISFRRVGVNAGDICFDKNKILDKNIQSHYFIKFEFIEDIEKLKKINFKSLADNTIGRPRSISKSEIIKELNLVL